MKRFVKLFTIILLAAIYVTFTIAVLILQLNPSVKLDVGRFLLLFLDLLVYYGPLVTLGLLVSFGIIQFFSDKKISIGFFFPATLLYFLSAGALLATVLLFVNYEYYRQIFSDHVHNRLVELIVGNLLIVVMVLIISFFRKGPRIWVQMLFLLIFGANIVFSFLQTQTIEAKLLRPANTTVTSPTIQGVRKIRIVMLDALSHRVVLQLMSRTDTLRNFQLLIGNGVHGHVRVFEPNTDLLVTSTFLSGLHPSQLPDKDDRCYQFRSIDDEFTLFPRYIFFRYSGYFFDLIAFYGKRSRQVVDRLGQNYEKQGLGTFQQINHDDPPIFSSLAIRQNNLFLQNFSYARSRQTPNFQLLKRTFFYDEYLKSMLPDLKSSDLYYAVIRIPGLAQITRHFFPYFKVQLPGTVPEEAASSMYAPILESYYHYYDSIIGNLISTTRDDEMLVIFGTYELELMPQWRRILYSGMGGERDISMYKPLHSRSVIYMYEKKALKRDYPLEDVSILDLYPTLLYYAGFSLPKNLQGEVLRGIFTDEFLSAHPIVIDPAE